MHEKRNLMYSKTMEYVFLVMYVALKYYIVFSLETSYNFFKKVFLYHINIYFFTERHSKLGGIGNPITQ